MASVAATSLQQHHPQQQQQQQYRPVFHEISDPLTKKVFYANVATGDCTWERPVDAVIHPRTGEEWWELWDDVHQLPYYFNTRTQETEWMKPASGTIIPLVAIQNSAIGKRVSVMLMQGSNGASTTNGDISVGGGFGGDRTRSESEFSAANMSKSILAGTVDHGRGSNTNGIASSHSYISTEPKLGGVSRANSNVGRGIGPRSFSSPGIDNGIVGGVKVPSNQDLASLPLVKREITKILPDDLKRHINQFRIDGFAKKYFAEHRKGILRKRVPVEKMLVYQKEPLRNPLMNLTKNLRRDALKCFAIIQRVMADTSAGPPYPSTLKDIETLLNLGVAHGGLRDEIYVQICKQVNKNPSFESTFRGWLLLCVITTTFPPSKNFEDYMRSFTHQHFNHSRSSPRLSPEGEKIAALAKFCDKKLMRICKSGPRGKVPTHQEIERAQEAPFTSSLFGESLEEIMHNQEEADAKCGIRDPSGVPRIVVFLVDSVLKLNGCATEGIFRVPADVDAVNDLRCRIEKGSYDLTGITDPNVPASLLKFWLRDLAEPLIPSEYYEACISLGKEEGSQNVALAAAETVNSLPAINRQVVNYIIKFLKVVGDIKNQQTTKMSIPNIAMVFAPNFLRCPSDNPVVIFESTKYEQSFLRILLR